MNREIKFRGQRIPNREWVYGSLVNNLWCYSDLSDFKEGTPICEIITGKYEGDCWEDITDGDDESIVTVYPDTVGQYTGLKDKHNNPIYEGDILRLNVGGVSKHIHISVCWNEDYGKWGTNAKMAGYYEELWECLEDEYDATVVGNIFSKPELLQQ